MNLIPLYDRIIIRRIDEDTNPDNRIVIPERAQEKSMLAEIVAIGPGKDHSVAWHPEEKLIKGNSTAIIFGRPETIPMKTKVGDIVLIGKYAGIEFDFDEEEYAILSEAEVLAILPPKAEPAQKK